MLLNVPCELPKLKFNEGNRVFMELFCWRGGSHWLARWPVWPDWAIYWTLSNLSKPLAIINLPKSSTFLRNFCKVVKINRFWATFIEIWQFFLVTLQMTIPFYKKIGILQGNLFTFIILKTTQLIVQWGNYLSRK